MPIYGDLFDFVGQRFSAVGGRPGGGDRSAGPPVELWPELALLGFAGVVGGIVMRVASHLPHSPAWAVVAVGAVVGCAGVRIAGRS